MSSKLCFAARQQSCRDTVIPKQSLGMRRLNRYFFGEAETEGAALVFGEVAGATETAADGAGFVVTGAELLVTLAEGAADDEGLTVGLPVAAGLGETETPGTGVAEIAGGGVCPLLNSRLRLLGVFAFRA